MFRVTLKHSLAGYVDFAGYVDLAGYVDAISPSIAFIANSTRNPQGPYRL